MISLLPQKFRPNRSEKASAISAVRPTAYCSGCMEEFRQALRKNLSRILGGNGPVAAWGPEFPRAFAQDPNALNGWTLDDYRSGILPPSRITMQLINEPGRLAAITTPGSSIGAELILAQLIGSVLSDGALRHEVGEHCWHFLRQRVLFYPDPPPVPMFSPRILFFLFASQPAQTSVLPDVLATQLRNVAAYLEAGWSGPSFWDQWLLRRCSETGGWTLPPAWSGLAWLRWQPGDPDPENMAGEALPGCWPGLLTLDP